LLRFRAVRNYLSEVEDITHAEMDRTTFNEDPAQVIHDLNVYGSATLFIPTPKEGE
jgi:hypothetical protein